MSLTILRGRNMKDGDLSNVQGRVIAFRCEDCLIKYKTEGVMNKILNAVIGKFRRAEIDPDYYKAMEYFYLNTEYVVDLVILRENYTQEMKSIIADIPYSRIILIDKESQVSQRLLIGDITVYVDDDDYRRSLVNSPYAVSLNELSNVVKRGKV